MTQFSSLIFPFRESEKLVILVWFELAARANDEPAQSCARCLIRQGAPFQKAQITTNPTS